MDDIQFWIYIIFAVIWVLSRVLAKKKKNQPERRPSSPLETEDDVPQLSFEDLLEEITGKKSIPKKKEIEPDPVSIQEERNLQPEPVRAREVPIEGQTRRFSDEESRKIYEESVKIAQSEDEFKPADKYFSKKLIQKAPEKSEDENVLAAEIKEMLRDANEVKKAIVINEILTRKY